jgi:hypothetical protein
MLPRPLALTAAAVLAGSLPAAAQQADFQGKVTMTAARGSQQFILKYTDGKPDNTARLFDAPAQQLMADIQAAGEGVSVTELTVKGTLVRAEMPQLRGYIIFDSESGIISMVRTGQYYTVFTPEDLQVLMGGMLPPTAGVPGAVRSAMDGTQVGEITGPARMGKTGDMGGLHCQWFEASAGNPTLAGQAGLRTQSCVTRDSEAAWKTFKAFMDALDRMPMMGGGKPGSEAQIQAALADEGLPVISKTIRRDNAPGATMVFEVATTEVHEGEVDAAAFTQHESLDRLQLQEFMMRMMGGR